MNNNTKNLVLTASAIGIGLVLSFIFHILFGATLGKILLPMHLPIFILALLIGPKYGMLAGFTLPLFSIVIIGNPPAPVAIPMAFELMTYGLVVGLLKDRLNIYLNLVITMTIGRIVSAFISFILFTVFNFGFGFKLDVFIQASLITSLPGILLQLFLIPIVIQSIKKSQRWQ